MDSSKPRKSLVGGGEGGEGELQSPQLLNGAEKVSKQKRSINTLQLYVTFTNIFLQEVLKFGTQMIKMLSCGISKFTGKSYYIESEVQSIRSLTVISVYDIFQRVQNDMQTGKCKSFQQTPIPANTALQCLLCIYVNN